jgi:hypothetical protein
MSKDKKSVVPVETNVVPIVNEPVQAAVGKLSDAVEKLSETDKLGLDLAKSKRQTALETAKTALALNEKSELEFKYLVLQLYFKYGMTSQDALDENGNIIRGGAVQAPQGQ